MMKNLAILICGAAIIFVTMPALVIFIEFNLAIICRKTDLAKEDTCVIWAMEAKIVNPNAYWKPGTEGK